MVGNSIVEIFLSALVPIYNRRRLKRCKESIGAFAMLESIHGPLTHCFPEFARRLRVNQRPGGGAGAPRRRR
eukprot:5927383-Pyramimonas_sp.AAC.1